jgi:branched-chain amino acid aminotransferase
MIDVLNLIAYKNGEYIPLKDIGPSILDFGFIHCDATYDVMPIYNGKAFCYNRHLARFRASAERYGLTIPDVDPLKIIKNLAKLNPIENAFVWFIIWRGFPPSGNPRDIENCPINFAMYIKPSYPLSVKGNSDLKVYLDTESFRVDDVHFGQSYKNMSWIELTMAQRKVPEGFDTCVLVDDNYHITEGPGFNIGFVDTLGIMTPANNCLKGITMSVVEDIAKEQKIDFLRTDIHASDWQNMDEIFLTSSSGGITPVNEGPITRLLMEEYEKKKSDPRYATEL